MKTLNNTPTAPIELKALNSSTSSNQAAEHTVAEDLFEIPVGCTVESVTEMVQSLTELPAYFIWWPDTLQMWCAPTEECLNKSFIYREDLEIAIVEDVELLAEYYSDRAAKLTAGKVLSHRCFILNYPALEKYEVYYAANYPMVRYGKVTPDGTTVMAFKDRFERDATILELEAEYENSRSDIKSVLRKQIAFDEALAVVDGSIVNNMAAAAIAYMDFYGMQRQSRVFSYKGEVAKSIDAELEAALMALRLCGATKKNNVTIYSDNSSVSSLINKGGRIDSRVAPKVTALLNRMRADGAQVRCLGIHTKNKNVVGVEDKALKYLHNMCDRECTQMMELYGVYGSKRKE